MNENQKIFLIINIIGGILVLGSYILGFKYGKGADALWGGVPEKTRGIYTISMLVSAIGFFIFTSYIFINLGSDKLSAIPLLGEKTFLILYSLLLIASALWIPLTNLMVTNPSSLVWFCVRSVLFITGIASILIFIALLTLNPRPSGAHYILTLVSIFIFSIHTSILDAIIWPYFWNK